MRPSGHFFYGNSMDPGNYLTGHGDGCGSTAVKSGYGDKAAVVKGTLDITRWVESDDSYYAELHSIISGVVGLDVFTKL